MAATDLIREKVAEAPMIYAYEHIGVPVHEGMLKVGYTTHDVETRVREQNQTNSVRYRIVLKRPAMRKDGTSFDDHLIHKILRKNHVRNPEGEWFVTDAETVERAIASAVEGHETIISRTNSFRMRPEQEAAVSKTSAYFKAFCRNGLT